MGWKISRRDLKASLVVWNNYRVQKTPSVFPLLRSVVVRNFPVTTQKRPNVLAMIGD